MRRKNDAAAQTLTIRNLPSVWLRAFRADAILRKLSGADYLVWLMLTHPEVKAREVPAGAHRSRRARPAR